MDLSLSSTLSLGFSSHAPPWSLESATHPVPLSLPSFKSPLESSTIRTLGSQISSNLFNFQFWKQISGMGRGGRARSGSGSRSGSSSRSCSGGSSSFKSTTAKTPRELVETYLGAAAIIAGGGNSVAGGGSLARTNSSGDFEDRSLWCQELMNCYYDASRLCGDDHYMTRQYQTRVRNFCGIEVYPVSVDNGSASASASAKL